MIFHASVMKMTGGVLTDFTFLSNIVFLSNTFDRNARKGPLCYMRTKRAQVKLHLFVHLQSQCFFIFIFYLFIFL